MATVCTLPTMYSCGHRLEEGENNPGLLNSSDARTGRESLQASMAEQGYLLLRNYLDHEEVLAARRNVLEQLAAEGQLDESRPVMQGVPKPGTKFFFQPELAQKNNQPLQHLLYSPQGKLMQFVSSFLGGEVRHFDFTWLRCVSPGLGTPSHCDIVYMGRGTHRLYTAWVPLGEVDFSLGGLMILEGSHRNRRLQETYGQRDVDVYCENKPDDPARTASGLNGWLSEDPNKIRQSLGGRWLTAEYHVGDVVIFGMNVVHGGMDNRSGRLRLSSDSRYQLASEPADERWVGENPPGHSSAGKRGRIC